MTAEPITLEAGQTIRAYITAERWIEIFHDGWTLKVTGNKGVAAIAGDGLKIISTEPAGENEL